MNQISREWRRDPLYELDPELNDLLRAELRRQQETLELIASENFASRAVLEATGSVLTNKYAEGYPGARYYGGCEIIDGVEQLAIDRCKELFGAEHANVQPHSGSSANLAALFALLEPGDTFLAMELSHGGHLTHGLPLNLSGAALQRHRLPCAPRHRDDRLRRDPRAGPRASSQAHHLRVQLLPARRSTWPPSARLPTSAARCCWPTSPTSPGWWPRALHPNPVPYCDVVTSTTHKTLTGPRAGLIMCRQQFARAIDRAVFPGMQGGPLPHVIAAKAVCLRIAASEEFRRLQRQIIDNAAALAETLSDGGLRLVTGGTDVHLVLVDLRGTGLGGLECQQLLESVNITANRNVVPFDESGPAMPRVCASARRRSPPGASPRSTCGRPGA